MKLKQLLAGILFCLATSATAQEAVPAYASSQDSIAYRAEVEKLMTVSGSMKALDVMIPQMKEMLRPRMVEGEGREMADRMFDAIFDSFADDMVDILTPIYRNYFTIEDIRGLNEFYATPVGQKYASCISEVSMEAMQTGQRYAQEKMAETIKKLQEKKLLREI